MKPSKSMQWLNEPAHWSTSDNHLIVTTSPQTDFWQTTHYGFIHNNGHFYFEHVDTDFVIDVEIIGNYKDLYDQAGVMIRTDEKHWIKTGIEYVDGVQKVSAVVTRDYSDWSVTPLLTPPQALHLRVERQREAVHISYKDANSQYTLLRLAYFPVVPRVQAGLMCASPIGDGYDVVFKNYACTAL